MPPTNKLIDLVVERLWRNHLGGGKLSRDQNLGPNDSVVLLPIGTNIDRPWLTKHEPCIILNKRSNKVRQPGDICCPGGGVDQGLDALIAPLLLLPRTPLTSWSKWKSPSKEAPDDRKTALLLAAGLREAYEEMGLNPFRVKFLGTLPVQTLRLFNRTIFPLVVWVPGQSEFRLNWEVDKIVILPLRKLFDHYRYARYQIKFPSSRPRGSLGQDETFPCFILNQNRQRELLWGVTFRIIQAFMQIVFDFKPPDVKQSPVFTNRIGNEYLTGRRP